MHTQIVFTFRALMHQQALNNMLESQRAKAIETYLKTHGGTAKVKNKARWVRWGGKPHELETYSIPMHLLIHNIRNGRFRSELLEREEQLGRKLNPANEEDAADLRKLLLEQNANETEALRADLIENGQEEPGIITFDGAVINANRRMAILWTLHEETRKAKYKNLEVLILPPGVDEADLWRIEAGLQFGKDFRLEYGGVNELLKLREGEERGLTPKDISVALQGRYTPSEVQDKLETLRLIDSYLVFIKSEGDYYKISQHRDLERFISLHNGVLKALKKKQGQKPLAAEVMNVAFALIDGTGLTHMNIRRLRHIAENKIAKNELFAAFGSKAPSSKTQVKASKEEMTEAFETANEIVEAQEASDKPEKLIKKAQAALDGIDLSSAAFKTPTVRAALQAIKKRVEELLKAVK